MKRFLILVLLIVAAFSVAKSKEVEGDWQTYFMPGVVLHSYIPDMKDSIGYFTGISIEYLIAAWIHQNDNHGPSHGRVYAKVNFMKSSKDKINDIFYVSIGLDLSLERNPKRNIFIPYFGVELGNMYQKQFGNVFTITPTFGVHIYSSQNMFINLTGGYVYPSVYLEDLRGYTVQLGMDFSLW